MFALKSVRAVYIPDPLGGIPVPEAISQELASNLAAKLRADTATQEDKDRLFLGHVSLGVSIAGKYVRASGCGAEDLVSEAILAIANAIVEAPEKLRDDNFTWFCTSKIHSRLTAVWEQELLQRKPLVDQNLKRKAQERADRLYEEILQATHNAVEERIVQLRAAGYSSQEIADEIGFSKRRVNQIREEIAKRFQAEVGK